MTIATGPHPCSSDMALSRMLALVGLQFPYVLGTGDYNGEGKSGCTTRLVGGLALTGMDCAGAAMSYAFKLPRHRHGYNRGAWATVSDDINTNSGIEDAEHGGELWTIVAGNDVRPGDLIAYPTIRIKDADGEVHVFVGHVQTVTFVPSGWTRARGFSGLKVAHCHGPNGRVPGVTLGDGHACDAHDQKWSKPQHRTRVLRVKL